MGGGGGAGYDKHPRPRIVWGGGYGYLLELHNKRLCKAYVPFIGHRISVFKIVESKIR